MHHFTKEQLVAAMTEAKASIDMPEKWCQGSLARDAQGRGVSPSSPSAIAICAVSALERAAKANAPRDPAGFGRDSTTSGAATALEYVLVGELCKAAGTEIADVHTSRSGVCTINNECRNHAELMAIFNKAINNLQQQPTRV